MNTVRDSARILAWHARQAHIEIGRCHALDGNMSCATYACMPVFEQKYAANHKQHPADPQHLTETTFVYFRANIWEYAPATLPMLCMSWFDKIRSKLDGRGPAAAWYGAGFPLHLPQIICQIVCHQSAAGEVRRQCGVVWGLESGLKHW